MSSTHIWVSLSIPEDNGHPILTVSAVEKIQKILDEEGVGAERYRHPKKNWIFWQFEYPTNEKRRLLIQRKLYEILIEDRKGRGGPIKIEPLIFWRGSVATIRQVRAMNEDEINE
jgi:hypothetical protein